MDWSQVVLFGIILFLIWYLNRKPKYFPPGPTGLPLVGYLPFVGKYSHETFQKLGKKYGNVLGIQMGNYNVVVLNDWTAIKEALVNQSDVFNGRPQNIVFEIASDYAGKCDKNC